MSGAATPFTHRAHFLWGFGLPDHVFHAGCVLPAVHADPGGRSSGRTSPLGSPLCNTCYDKQYGVLMGMMGGSPGLAVAGPGIMRWVRESLDPKRKAARLEAESQAKTRGVPSRDLRPVSRGSRPRQLPNF